MRGCLEFLGINLISEELSKIMYEIFRGGDGGSTANNIDLQYFYTDLLRFYADFTLD